MLVPASQADGAVPGEVDQFVGADGMETSGAVFGLVTAMRQGGHKQAGFSNSVRMRNARSCFDRGTCIRTERSMIRSNRRPKSTQFL